MLPIPDLEVFARQSDAAQESESESESVGSAEAPTRQLSHPGATSLPSPPATLRQLSRP